MCSASVANIAKEDVDTSAEAEGEVRSRGLSILPARVLDGLKGVARNWHVCIYVLTRVERLVMCGLCLALIANIAKKDVDT
jgi:hypothetical protein